MTQQTRDRDVSHGVEHAQNVVTNAKIIMQGMNITYDMYKHVLIIAWLHDVCDHKYGEIPGQQKELTILLKQVSPIYWKQIQVFIDTISYSREQCEGPYYYEQLLKNEQWIVSRNIVSDADKLEAIGSRGLDRCTTFLKHKLGPRASKALLFGTLCAHVDEKLVHIYEKFIRTDHGKILAYPQHRSMMQLMI